MRCTVRTSRAVLALRAACVSGVAVARTDRGTNAFWVPGPPPCARYVVDCQIDPDCGRLSGSETITLKNDARAPLARFVLAWPVAEGPDLRRSLDVRVHGQGIVIVEDAKRLVVDLPTPLESGQTIDMEIRFQLEGWPALGPDDDEVLVKSFTQRETNRSSE